MHTHINTHTHSWHRFVLYNNKKETFGAQEIEISSHLHFSKPPEPFHLCRASLLHLSPPQMLLTGSGELIFPQYIAKYKRYVFFYFIFLQSKILAWSQVARISASTYLTRNVSVSVSAKKGSQATPANYRCWHLLTKYSIHLGVQICGLFCSEI